MFGLIPWRKRKQQVDENQNLIPYQGMSSLAQQMRNEFDQLFDRFFSGLQWPGLLREEESHWGLLLAERDNEIVVTAEAPGFDAKDFDLQVKGNRLVLQAKKEEKKEKNGSQQQWQRELYRSVTLPDGLDTDHIDATYKNGILNIKLPKTERYHSKRITVKE